MTTLIYLFLALMLAFSVVRFGWRAWRATGQVGRGIVVMLSSAGVGLIAAGVTQAPVNWTMLIPGIAAATAVGSWMVYQAMAFSGVSPNLVAGPEALDMVEGVVLDVASIHEHMDREDD